MQSVHDSMDYFLKRVNPRIKSTRHTIINNPKINFAIDAAPAAIPVNPKIAAIIAITKNMAAHLSIIIFV